MCQVIATTAAETHVYTFSLSSCCSVLCFLVEFCSGFLVLGTKSVSRGAAHWTLCTDRSDIPWDAVFLGGKRVIPHGSRAWQRPRSATRWLQGPCQEPVLPWRLHLRDKSPELLRDNQAAATGNPAAWACWGISEGSLGANCLFAYGTVLYTYVS